MAYKDPAKRVAYDAAYHAAHKEERAAYHAAHMKRRSQGTLKNKAIGTAAEKLVEIDLIERGILCVRYVVDGPSDIAISVSSGWKTIDVKTARVNMKTGSISTTGSEKISADIGAFVDVPTRRIRYYPVNIPELPEELTREA
jgi:hypothetical protein